VSQKITNWDTNEYEQEPIHALTITRNCLLNQNQNEWRFVLKLRPQERHSFLTLAKGWSSVLLEVKLASGLNTPPHPQYPAMKTDKPVKKGFFALLRESFTKTGGCCGAGETCGGSSKSTDKPKPTKEPCNPAQK